MRDYLRTRLAMSSSMGWCAVHRPLIRWLAVTRPSRISLVAHGWLGSVLLHAQIQPSFTETDGLFLDAPISATPAVPSTRNP